MEKCGWKYVMSTLLLVLFFASVIFYVRELSVGPETKGATLGLLPTAEDLRG